MAIIMPASEIWKGREKLAVTDARVGYNAWRREFDRFG
jgi:hypothetical protein